MKWILKINEKYDSLDELSKFLIALFTLLITVEIIDSKYYFLLIIPIGMILIRMIPSLYKLKSDKNLEEE